MKKIIAILTALALGLSFGACADENENSTSDLTSEQSTWEETTEDATSEESVDVPGVGELENISQYIKLGAWKGINVAEKKEVTDKIIESIKNEKYLKEYAEEEDKGAPAENGDKVVIDYKGYLVETNEAFEGGEAKDVPVTLGSGGYVDGFESGIVGHSAGESFDIYLTFPEEYHEGLKGKEVRFAITLDSVKVSVFPQVDAELAKKLGFDSVEAFDKAVLKDAEHSVYVENMTTVWSAVIEDAEVLEYPKAQFDDYVKYFVDYNVSKYKYYATMYGVELKEYLSAMSMTEEEFYADLNEKGTEYAKGALKEQLTMYAVADAAFNREVSDEEFEQRVEEYAEENSTTVDALMKQYKKEGLMENILWDKVMVYLYDNAVFGAVTE